MPTFQQFDDAHSGGASYITLPNFSVGNGDSRSLVAFVWGRKTDVNEGWTFSAPTFNDTEVFNSAQLVSGTTKDVSQYWRMDMFTLDNPTNTTGDIVVIVNSNPGSAVQVTGIWVGEYTNANNGTSEGSANGWADFDMTTAGTESELDLSDTSEHAENLILAAVSVDDSNAFPITENATETVRAEDSVNQYWVGEVAPTGGVDVIDLTMSSACQWITGGFELVNGDGIKHILDTGRNITKGRLTLAPRSRL